MVVLVWSHIIGYYILCMRVHTHEKSPPLSLPSLSPLPPTPNTQENPLPWLPLPAWQAMHALCDHVEGFAKLGQVCVVMCYVDSEYDLFMYMCVPLCMWLSGSMKMKSFQITALPPHTHTHPPT